MRVEHLPKVGIIKNRLELDCAEKLGVSYRNKDVLAIGYSQEQLYAAIEIHKPRSITLMTKWSDHMDAKIPGYEIIIGDIGGVSPFKPGQFDVISTLSVLEHISDIPQAFSNIAVLLRPDGVFLSTFGPVWSCAYGHHLYADPNDPLVCFSRWEMPGWMHLLSDGEEIRSYFRANGKADYESEFYVRQIFESDMINRVMYEDYISAINEFFNLSVCWSLYNKCPPDIYRALRNKYPRYTDFSTYGGAWVAIKQS